MFYAQSASTVISDKGWSDQPFDGRQENKSVHVGYMGWGVVGGGGGGGGSGGATGRGGGGGETSAKCPLRGQQGRQVPSVH